MNYPYANGIIKTQENTILDKTKLIRIPHDTTTMMVRELQEMGYGDPQAPDLEALISSELKKVKTLMNAISPEPQLSSLLFLNDDAINIKILFKKKIFGYQPSLSYAMNGSLSQQELLSWMEGQGPLSQKLFDKALSPLRELTAQKTSSRALSSQIDSILYKSALASIHSIYANSLKVYFQRKIDYTNLISMIRSRALNWTVDEFMEMFIEGGELTGELLASIYPLPNQAMVSGLKTYDFGKVSEDLEKALTRNDLGLLEIYFENRLLAKMKEYHADPFSIGPMLYFVLMKKAEAQNIRTIASNPHFDAQSLLDY